MADASAAASASSSKRSRSRSPRRTEGQNLSSADPVAEAAALLAQLPPAVEQAQAVLDKALIADPKNVEILDALGALLCDEGDATRAVTLFKQSVALRPDEGAEKYLYLAQMTEGEVALGHFESGCAVLDRVIQANATDTLARKQLATSQASIAELYMTDLCDLPEAEEKCEAALAKGLTANENCLEILATTASLRKVQGKMEESTKLALDCAARVSTALKDQGLLTADGQEKDEAEEPDCLSDEDIVALCRTLIDLGQAPEARGLLEVMLEKDEEDVQIWILLGYCHIEEKDADAVQECVVSAIKLCKRLKRREAAEWKSNLKDLTERWKDLKAASAADDEGDEDGEEDAEE